MKKLLGWMVVLVVLVAMVGFANAYPKASGAVYERIGDNVKIKNLPLSAIKAIEIYNDCKGTEKRVLSPATEFNLVGCEGFNTVWSDGKAWFDMITPYSKANGLTPLCDQANDNCKWVRTDSPQLLKK